MLSLISLIQRVIGTNRCAAKRFYSGLIWRLLERIFDIAPFLVVFFWFQFTLNTSTLDSETLDIGTLNTGTLDMSYGANVFSQWLNSGWEWISMILILLLLMVAQLVCNYWGQLNSYLGAYELVGEYRERMIDQVQQMSMNRLLHYPSGYLAAILTDDLQRVEKIFTHLIAELFAAIVAPLLFLVLLLVYHWPLGLSLFIALPPAVWVLNFSRRFFLKHSCRKQEQLHQVSGLFVEFIAGIWTLRLFNQAAPWLARLDRYFADIHRQSMGVELWAAGSVQLYRIIVECGLVVLLMVGAYLAQQGELNTITWLLFVLLAYKILDPLLDVAIYITELSALLQSGARLQQLFEPGFSEGTKGDNNLIGEIVKRPKTFDLQFEAISFRYEENWVIEDLSFCALAGQVTAIVGPSGSGKSTLLHLLASFYAPQKGHIKIGHLALSDIPSEQLYSYMSFVFQEVQLFDGKIMENVRIGRPTASDQEVIAVCKAAYCEPFIQQLPDGYQTRIGENGGFLSGGERQRLSIARALLKNAPILLLDEATASVDPDTQYEIQKALSKLIQGRTVLVIAHRLSTVRFADQILVLQNGQLMEQGTHASLIAQAGLYAELWQEQDISNF